MLGKKIAAQHRFVGRDPGKSGRVIAPEMLMRVNFHDESSVKIEETAVDRVIGSGDEGSVAGAEKQREGSDFLGTAHATDRLQRGETLERFGLLAGIILLNKTVDERSVNAGRRDAVAADVVVKVIAGDGKCHGDDGAFAGGVGQTFSETGGAGDGGDVEDHASAVLLHFRDGVAHSDVVAAHVDTHQAIEGFAVRVIKAANVRNADAVDQDVDFGHRRESGGGLRFVGEVAGAGRAGNFRGDALGVFAMDVEDVNP